jgi:hypothetical protein
VCIFNFPAAVIQLSDYLPIVYNLYCSHALLYGSQSFFIGVVIFLLCTDLVLEAMNCHSGSQFIEVP